MSKYKVVISWLDGEVMDSYEYDGESGLFDSKEEAKAAGLYMVDCGEYGDELSGMSDPTEATFGNWGAAKVKVVKVNV